jgi:hypothetical protein
MADLCVIHHAQVYIHGLFYALTLVGGQVLV